MLYMWETPGTLERAVLAHSPGYPTWGMFYRDIDDRFLFRNGGSSIPSLAVDLPNNRVGVNTDAPAAQLHVAGRILSSPVSGQNAGMTTYPPDGGAWWHIDAPGVGVFPTGGASGGRFRVSHGAAPGTFEMFTILQNGDAWHSGAVSVQNLSIRSGAKPGYVFDHFVNRAGDAVEQGDVVVLGEGDAAEFWATNNDVPIPEIDLCAQAYDRRVCGVVASVVTGGELPFAEGRAEGGSPRRSKPRGGEAARPADAGEGEAPHPLARFAAEGGEGHDRTRVGKGQLGSMVTLGAYSYCKVDADIAPVRAGDLLTTSPTRGHAQKVDDPSAAVGSIIGKALGSLEKGRGKIPVLVMMQ
jgi:hypothetical protein